MVEAAGVELIRVLTTRKLLILGTATTARKAPLPNPLYVYCTRMPCCRPLGSSNCPYCCRRRDTRDGLNRDDRYRWMSSEMGRKGSIHRERKALAPHDQAESPLDFLGVSLPNGRGFPTRLSRSGWFSDGLSFNPQMLLPRDGGSCRSDFGGSSCAVQPVSEVSIREVESRAEGSLRHTANWSGAI